MEHFIEALGDKHMSREMAVDLYESHWWEKYPARDVALAQLRQDRLCMPFSEFQRIVEEAIGGHVWTHEFAKPDILIERIEGCRRGGHDPFRTLGDIILRRTRSGLWVTKGRRYRTKALAMASRVVAITL